MSGTNATIDRIRQGAEQNHKPALYIEPVAGITQEYEAAVQEALADIMKEYPGVPNMIAKYYLTTAALELAQNAVK